MVRLGNIIFYVEDVEKTIAFFEKAFGLKRHFIDPTKRYGQLQTGHTALGFASHELAHSNLPSGFRKIDANDLPVGCEISFLTSNVQASFAQAVEAGAVVVALPLQKDWGQIVGYVRDPNGILIEVASEMQGCASQEEEMLCCDHGD